MHPILVPSLHIGAYSAFWLAAFFFAFLAARLCAKRAGVEGRHIDNLFLILLIAAPVGARLFNRLFYMPDTSFLDALKLWRGGGLVFYGGLMAGILSLAIYCKFARLGFLRMAEVFCPALALGLAVGRVGCFFAGCCWGDVCVDEARVAGLPPETIRQVRTVALLSGPGFPLAVKFPEKSDAFKQHKKLELLGPGETRSLPVHPAQLYEAAAAFALFLVLMMRFTGSHERGAPVKEFAIGYACLRFTVEFFRADNAPEYLGLTISQVISVLIFASALVFAAALRKRRGARSVEMAGALPQTESQSV